MGLLDFLSQGGNGDPSTAPQYSDVPIGYRLGMLGNILSSAAAGQPVNPASFAIAAKMKADAVEQRKQAKQMELAAKYLEKRPDLKPLVESGAVSIADIIKMDADSAAKAADRQAEQDWWKTQEQWKIDHDPNREWFKQFSGVGGTTPPPATGTESVTPPGSGTVPTPPVAGTPDMPPAPGTQANNPITARMRQATGDNALTDTEAMYLYQTVRNPDDLRAAYNNILTHRTEAQKAQAAADDAAAKKAEAEQKKLDAEASKSESQMTAVSAIDKTLRSLDAEGLPAAGTAGYLFSNVPGTNAYEAATNIDTLKSFISLDKLQNMRANSPSGASGLGQVSNYEQKLLGNVKGAIDQGLSEGSLRESLMTVRNKVIAFNTPSKEDPTKSILTMDSEKLAANPTPEAVAQFDAKYGIGSSAMITGNMDAPSNDTNSNNEVQVDDETKSILELYPPGGN